MKDQNSKAKTSKALNRNGKSRSFRRPNHPAPMSVKRPPLARMKEILALLQEGKYPNCSTIARLLEKSPKTAIRDIDFMRDSLELPIEYDDKRHGFYLTKPVERFPMVPVTERELFYVCVAHKAIEHYRGTPLEKPLELAFKKFAGRLDDEDQIFLQSLEDVLSIRPFAPDDADLQLFDVLTQGITERRLLKFQYRKPGEKSSRIRRVHPYHMLEFGSRWYLIAYDLDGKVVRKYVPGRMRDLKLTNERFSERKDFDPKTYFRGSVGVVTGEGDYEVVIEMDAWLTDILRGRRFHPKQVWTEVAGAGSHLKLRLDSLDEIEQHVLSWGTHANVLGPRELVERIHTIVSQLASRYAGHEPQPVEVR
jgi:predicted DNA-binding transcriptional regulator YafY